MRIKFFLVLVLMMVTVSGCFPGSGAPEDRENLTEVTKTSETRYYKRFDLYYYQEFIERFYDPEFGTVCYAYVPDGGISCILVGEK